MSPTSRSGPEADTCRGSTQSALSSVARVDGLSGFLSGRLQSLLGTTPTPDPSFPPERLPNSLDVSGAQVNVDIMGLENGPVRSAWMLPIAKKPSRRDSFYEAHPLHCVVEFFFGHA